MYVAWCNYLNKGKQAEADAAGTAKTERDCQQGGSLCLLEGQLRWAGINNHLPSSTWQVAPEPAKETSQQYKQAGREGGIVTPCCHLNSIFVILKLKNRGIN